jgi:hypothetical protein
MAFCDSDTVVIHGGILVQNEYGGMNVNIATQGGGAEWVA